MKESLLLVIASASVHLLRGPIDFAFSIACLVEAGVYWPMDMLEDVNTVKGPCTPAIAQSCYLVAGI